MMVCHCMSITDHDIRAAVEWMRAADPDTVVTPGKVYHALGKRADCGGCMTLFLGTMRTSAGFAVPASDAPPHVPRRLRTAWTGPNARSKSG